MKIWRSEGKKSLAAQEWVKYSISSRSNCACEAKMLLMPAICTI